MISVERCTVFGGSFNESVPKQPGYYDIKAHGDTDRIKIYNTSVDAEELAEIITSRKDYSGSNIRLLSCYTGNDRTEKCLARELSKLIPVRVKAPTGEFIASSFGRTSVAEASSSGNFAIYYKGELIGYERN